MANPVLLKSSVCMGFLHGIPILAWQTWQVDWWITLVYVIGVLTSLINHGLTHAVFKWGDRAWMSVGCATDLAYILMFCTGYKKVIMLALLLSYVAAFFLAKLIINKKHAQQSGDLPHLFTHAGASVLHIWLLLTRVRL